jgi:hypothetical protein
MRGQRTTAALAGGAFITLALAGCGASHLNYIKPGDPVIAACQQPAVANLDDSVQAIDNANNNSGGISGNGTGQMMSDAQVKDLKAGAISLAQIAVKVRAGHPGFADSLLNEAQQFSVAAASPTGLTTNTVAIATDKYQSQIDKSCASFTVGTPPPPGKAGPGADWSLVFEIIIGYCVMIFVTSYLIAVGERAKPKNRRMEPYEIFWLSTVWWVALLIRAGVIWGQLIETATKTPDEKKEERMNALAAENRKLETRLAEANAEIAKSLEP